MSTWIESRPSSSFRFLKESIPATVYILGINAYHGDAAAAIVRDGELIAAVEDKRLLWSISFATL